ncbi:MAG: DUF6178 family protein [Polyangiaceae bacterium]|nr:DUF6178 family protein [Polyangiaceae bacterium]
MNRLIELPDLAHTIQALPVQTFAALVRKVGIEDAGELLALATTEQLVQAFDEDLFQSDHAGERETLDVGRFVVWLEVLLDVGDEAAADRIAELDEDFVAHALSGILLVLDEEALRERLNEIDEDEFNRVDKALGSALMEDMDGYILVAKRHDGWDAALALVLALDRNHRALLVRLLDRLARVGTSYLDDLEELSTVLSEGESLAEDVEAAREDRRSQQGHVETQAARAFLTLARKPLDHDERSDYRDPLTRAYFRELEQNRLVVERAVMSRNQSVFDSRALLPPAIQRELDEVRTESASLAIKGSRLRTTAMGVFMDAMRELSRKEMRLFGERMEEFAYLTNVLLAGHERDGARLRPREAADAVIATVSYGAAIEVRARRAKGKRREPLSVTEFAEVLRKRSADVLFRIASSALVTGSAPKVKAAKTSGLLYSAEELETAMLTPGGSQVPKARR